MFWLILAKGVMSDDAFWLNLRKLLRYVHKGSGRIVFHMLRKSRSWQHEGVKAVLESYGLFKVSSDLNGEMTTVTTNDQRIREFLNPTKSIGTSAVCTAAEGTIAPVEWAARVRCIDQTGSESPKPG